MYFQNFVNPDALSFLFGLSKDLTLIQSLLWTLTTSWLSSNVGLIVPKPVDRICDNVPKTDAWFLDPLYTNGFFLLV